ncbi:MAG: flagellar FlbD family protein [Oscillospiraceae bacterium]|nr:flagellar FlbD family protein [Oscillospiraceae bacterium]
MIELTKLNKKKFVLNCELIETVEATPDTVVTLRNGKLIIVMEPPEEVIRLTVAYRQSLYEGLLRMAVKTTPVDPNRRPTEPEGDDF